MKLKISYQDMSRAKNAIFLQKEIESLIYLPDQIVQLDHLNQNFSNHYCILTKIIDY
jgi:hypothetical protein